MNARPGIEWLIERPPPHVVEHIWKTDVLREQDFLVAADQKKNAVPKPSDFLYWKGPTGGGRDTPRVAGKVNQPLDLNATAAIPVRLGDGQVNDRPGTTASAAAPAAARPGTASCISRVTVANASGISKASRRSRASSHRARLAATGSACAAGSNISAARSRSGWSSVLSSELEYERKCATAVWTTLPDDGFV
eukprot:TRINITY_DN41127_c0_g1_i1.p2 TRINITY_DN41127_c0_g1~~TRINITY_DN41127_c0_g1_i1.p2  ORF type:complete len:193 (+),score=23.02 TRINITY_DN41127_c0_g1_i1:109-687(+)